MDDKQTNNAGTTGRCLNPIIDMSSLHSLSPGGNTVPAPPPPSPLLFSSNNDNSTTATVAAAMGTGGPSTSSSCSFSKSSEISRGPGPCIPHEKLRRFGTGEGGETDKGTGTTSPMRRFFIPPTLEKKHSSGDLHSRLKTRKILGVGETDNGDIHRSKISQVLGHNEHLYLKLPMGYWNWQLFLSGFLASQAALLILLPSWSTSLGIAGIPPVVAKPQVIQSTVHSEDLEASADGKPEVIVVFSGAGGQYYGAALLSLAFFSWKFLHVNDKMIIRATQFATIVHFSMVCCIDFITILNYGFSAVFENKLILLMFGFRLIVCIVCYMYLNRLGLPSAGLRRSPSYKESCPSAAAALDNSNNDGGGNVTAGGEKLHTK